MVASSRQQRRHDERLNAVHNLDAVPHSLKDMPQWGLWAKRCVGDRDDVKVPFTISGAPASVTRAEDWRPFPETLSALCNGDGRFDGLGFRLTGQRFVVIDIDHCRIDGVLRPEVRQLVDGLGTYAEYSQSGNGVHIWVLLPDGVGLPNGKMGTRNRRLEVYFDRRYIVMTGDQLEDTPAEPVRNDLAFQRFWKTYVEDETAAERPGASASSQGPMPEPLRLDDLEILRIVQRSKRAATFERLRRADWQGLYPSQSEAEAAFFEILTFYTRDAAQLERIANNEALFQREKWTNRPDRRATTIANAIAFAESVNQPMYSGPRSQRPRVDDPASGGTEPTVEPVPSEPGGRKSQATQLIELVGARDVALWHSPAGDSFVTVRISEHLEHHSIGSKAFRTLLARWFWLAEGKSIGSQALQDAIGTLDGQARFEGEEYPLASRITHHCGAVWVDLGCPAWRALRIDASGHQIVSSKDVPVKFRRTRSILPIPDPEQGGTLDELRQLFSLDDDNWMLLLGCLIGVFQADGGRAQLELVGRQGSGKSTLARMFVSLVDPSEVPVRSMPKDEEALLIAVQHRSVLALDNVSNMPGEMSDAVCRVSTGGGLGRRQLYSDSDEVLLKVQLPLVWTGIAPVTTNRPDLADRTLSVTLEPLDSTQYRSERSLLAEFEAMRPRLFGALCDAVSMALRNRDTVRLAELPRLADFALWVEAAAPAFEWEPGAFTAALGLSRINANAQAIDASPIGQLVVDFTMAQTQAWESSATDLLTVLRDRADDETRRARGFPRQANHLSNALRRLQPALITAGVYVGFGRNRDGSIIRLERASTTGHVSDDDRMVF